MKFNVDKFREMARPLNEKEQEAMNFIKENRSWLRLSCEIALKIREVLKEKGLTQADLATRMGVTAAQVSKLLSGKMNLELKTIDAVQQALGTSILTIDLSIPPQPSLSLPMVYSEPETTIAYCIDYE